MAKKKNMPVERKGKHQKNKRRIGKRRKSNTGHYF